MEWGILVFRKKAPVHQVLLQPQCDWPSAGAYTAYLEYTARAFPLCPLTCPSLSRSPCLVSRISVLFPFGPPTGWHAWLAVRMGGNEEALG